MGNYVTDYNILYFINGL